MYTQDDIIKKIQNGLQELCSTYNIHRKEIRVKISMGMMNIGVRCVLMKNEEVVKNSSDKAVTISISELMKLEMGEAAIANVGLGKLLSKLAEKPNHNIEKSKVNARIYTNDSNFYPSVTLYSENRVVNDSISIQDLTVQN